MQMEREMDGEREDSPLRCWTTERNKCLQGLELNSRNYYSVPLEVMRRHYPSLSLTLSLCTQISDFNPQYLHSNIRTSLFILTPTPVPQGSLLDHPVSVCTTGRYLVAGLRDGGVNVNNLTVRFVLCFCSLHAVLQQTTPSLPHHSTP